MITQIQRIDLVQAAVVRWVAVACGRVLLAIVEIGDRVLEMDEARYLGRYLFQLNLANRGRSDRTSAR